MTKEMEDSTFVTDASTRENSETLDTPIGNATVEIEETTVVIRREYRVITTKTIRSLLPDDWRRDTT